MEEGNGSGLTLFTKDDTSGEYVEYTPPEPKPFRETLSEEIRDSEHLADVEDADKLARYYVDLKSNYLAPPDTADGYEFETPEGFEVDQEANKVFKDLAFEHGLNQKQFAEIMKFEFNRQQNAEKQVKADIEKHQQDAETALKTEWGDNYEAKLEAAKSVINHESLVDDNFKKFLEDTRFGDNPNVIRIFAKIAELISEDVLVKPGTGKDVNKQNRTEDGRPMLSFPSMEGK